ncbi:hypothetical protein [Actinopolyspora mortivallis]|uniref:hypothetical protein n=1 Tax=Actinopolyspora mortivallis TaxID=33906 RepID=UPI000374DC6E|nr:hypothetical protein [Actinopolyspora mortivallis]
MLTRVVSRVLALVRTPGGHPRARTGPGSRVPTDEHGGPGEATTVTTELPPPRGLANDRTWIASHRESRWHASEKFVSPHSHRATGACGHTVRGPHECRHGHDPPEQPHRSLCGPCLHAIGYLPPRTIPHRRLSTMATPAKACPAGTLPQPGPPRHHRRAA